MGTIDRMEQIDEQPAAGEIDRRRFVRGTTALGLSATLGAAIAPRGLAQEATPEARRGGARVLSILRLKEGVAADVVQDLVVDEVRAIWDRYLDGRIRELYGVPGGPGAVLMLESETVEAARADLEEMPLARAGYLDVQLVELRPFVAWAELFAEEERAAAVEPPSVGAGGRGRPQRA